MKRSYIKWCSFAIVGFGALPIVAQDWKPVSTHTARYEEAATSSMSLLGRPITGRSKVDQAIERTGFAGDNSMALPIPQAPAGKSYGVETLPPPRVSASGYPIATAPANAVLPPNMKLMPAAQTPPMGAGTVIYPGSMPYPSGDFAQGQPQPGGPPVVVNGPIDGQIFQGAPIYDGGAFPGMQYSGGMSDRYFLQSIHGSPGLWYGSLDFVLFSVTPDKAPALVITGPQNTTSILDGTVVYGGSDLPTDTMLGGRVSMGVWFNRRQSWGMFGSFFTTQDQAMHYQAGSADGSTFYARPFFNTSTVNFNGTPRVPAEDLEQVSQLGTALRPALGGFVNIDRTSKLRGADLNFRFNLCNNFPPCRRTHWNIDGYAGVKYLGFDETLNITENINVLNDFVIDPNTTLLQGTQFFVQDRFSTQNAFIGGNIGLISEARMGRFFIEMRTGIALGGTQQTVTIGGNTQVTTPNGQTTGLLTGGLLAQESNIGTNTRSQFSYVPELGLKLGLQVTDHLRVFAGYEMMYWSNVVRPGQQIDRSVNASQLPQFPGPTSGEVRPLFNYQTSNLWISGFSAGVSWIF
ncbi:MAG: BBP7 family outer membrane beta-barrel protein [Planctomycetia bacterium]|nr:BBP7 family outer membrane beta-barrel protein [Planctomycetia bacterium]